MKFNKNILYISYIGILTSLALIFSYIESFIPIPVPIPGVKIGLSNIVILIAIYIFDNKISFISGLFKVIISALLFGTPISFMLSLAGFLLSYTIMIIIKSLNRYSLIFVSILGGILHNTGQIIIAFILMGNGILVYYPVLVISGIITGLIIGSLSKLIFERIKINDRFY